MATRMPTMPKIIANHSPTEWKPTFALFPGMSLCMMELFEAIGRRWAICTHFVGFNFFFRSCCRCSVVYRYAAKVFKATVLRISLAQNEYAQVALPDRRAINVGFGSNDLISAQKVAQIHEYAEWCCRTDCLPRKSFLVTEIIYSRLWGCRVLLNTKDSQLSTCSTPC